MNSSFVFCMCVSVGTVIGCGHTIGGSWYFILMSMSITGRRWTTGNWEAQIADEWFCWCFRGSRVAALATEGIFFPSVENLPTVKFRLSLGSSIPTYSMNKFWRQNIIIMIRVNNKIVCRSIPSVLCLNNQSPTLVPISLHISLEGDC